MTPEIKQALFHLRAYGYGAEADRIESALTSAEPVACIDERHLHLLRQNWSQGNTLKHPKDAGDGDVLLYTHAQPAAKVEEPRNSFERYDGSLSDFAPTPASVPDGLAADDVQWIVNDKSELGVMIHGKAFFLYNNESLVYPNAKHEVGTPIHFRYSKDDSIRWHLLLPTKQEGTTP